MVGMHYISCPRADKKVLMALCSNWQKHKVCTPISGTASWFQLKHVGSRQLPN